MRRAAFGVILAAAILALGVIGAGGAGWYRTHDFYALYSGGRIVAQGGDPYDERLWCAETENTTPEAFDASRDIAVCFMRYAYPLWTAVALVPLGILPLPIAASLWLAISIALSIVAMRWAWIAVGGARPFSVAFAVTVVFSQPFFLLLALGQLNAFLFAVVANVAYGIGRSRDRAAGAALAGAAFKPNVLPVFAAAMLVWAIATRRTTFVISAIAAGVVLLLGSIAVQPFWLARWLQELFGRQIGHAVEYATVWGFAAVDLHDVRLAPVLVVVLVVVVALTAGEHVRDPIVLACVAVPVSLFVTPYAWSYDALTLALPWAFVLATASRASGATGRILLILVLLVASLAPWLLWAIAQQRHTESLTALVPAATAILVAVAARISGPGRRPLSVARP